MTSSSAKSNRLYCWTAALAWGVFGSLSVAQGQDVTLSLSDAFGGSGSAFVAVELQNNTRSALRGVLALDSEDFGGGRVHMETPADLPARATRVFRFEYPVGRAINASFVRSGRAMARGSLGYGGGVVQRAVLIADPPRLRGTLAGLEGEMDPTYGRRSALEAGSVSFDEGGRPVAPRSARGWAGTELVVASARDLDRFDDAQLRALDEHVRAGARLFLIAPTPGDLQRRAVAPYAAGIGFDSSGQLAPAREDDVQEAFGVSRRHGFGRVWLSARDFNMPGLATAEGTKGVFTALLRPDVLPAPPRLPLFRDEQGGFSMAGPVPFGELRAALDPNESFRPALGLVAILFLIYVVLVGPVNFRRVRKRGRPTLALITTPLLALSCFVLFGLVGFVGKGVRMRYRSATFTELISGDEEALSRTYFGLFATRPRSFELAFEGYGALASPEERRANYGRRDGAETLEDLRAGLWETIFARDERFTALDGTVHLEQESGVLRRVENSTSRSLRSAVIVDGSGQVYAVGDVAAGASVNVPVTPIMTIQGALPEYDPSSTQFFRTLGAEGEQARELLRGLFDAAGGTFGPSPSFGASVLLAQVDGPEGDVAGFGQEAAMSLLLVRRPAFLHPVAVESSSASQSPESL